MPSRWRFSIAGVSVAVVAGLGLYWLIFGTLLPMTPLLIAKAQGRGPLCSWWKVLTLQSANTSLARRMQELRKGMTVVGDDGRLVKVRGPWGDFWLSKQGSQWSGADLLAYVMAEREWVAERHPESTPEKGMVALDCGAHVGTFTRFALNHSVSKVIAIEPAPWNAECFRRNFATEIQAGTVILVPKGAWSSAGTLKLSEGKRNSGTSTFVDPDKDAAQVEVATDTLDSILAGLGITHVDYIKMDVQGAEVEVLKGARQLIARSHPRMLFDADNLPDDQFTIPRMVRSLRSDYQLSCGPCELGLDNASVIPHTLFLRLP